MTALEPCYGQCGITALQAEIARLQQQIPQWQPLVVEWQSSPWPIQDVLRKLADAVTHLLTVHDCDHQGWEGVTYARNRAIEMADALAPIGSDTPRETTDQ